MPGFATDPPLIAAWVDVVSASQRLQYAPVVRGFFRKRGSNDIAGVQTRELVHFVLELPKESMRPKATAALRHFFAFAANLPPGMVDPARGLGKAVQRGRLELKLISELQRAGISQTLLLDLSWRDVIPIALGESLKLSSVRVESGLMTSLAEALLKRLRQSPDAQAAIASLNAPFLEFN